MIPPEPRLVPISPTRPVPQELLAAALRVLSQAPTVLEAHLTEAAPEPGDPPFRVLWLFMLGGSDFADAPGRLAQELGTELIGEADYEVRGETVAYSAFLLDGTPETHGLDTLILASVLREREETQEIRALGCQVVPGYPYAGDTGPYPPWPSWAPESPEEPAAAAVQEPDTLPERVPRLAGRTLTDGERAVLQHQRRRARWGALALALGFVAGVFLLGLGVTGGKAAEALALGLGLGLPVGSTLALGLVLRSSTRRAGQEAWVERLTGPYLVIRYTRGGIGRLIAGQEVALPPEWLGQLPERTHLTAEVFPARAGRFRLGTLPFVLGLPTQGLSVAGPVPPPARPFDPGEARRMDRPLTEHERAFLGRTYGKRAAQESIAPGEWAALDDEGKRDLVRAYDLGELYRVTGPVRIRRSPFTVWIGDVAVDFPPHWRGELREGMRVEAEAYLSASQNVPLLIRLGSRSLDAEAQAGTLPRRLRPPTFGREPPLLLLVVVLLSTLALGFNVGVTVFERQDAQEQAVFGAYDARFSALETRVEALRAALCARRDTRLDRDSVFDGAASASLSEAGTAVALRELAALRQKLTDIPPPPPGYRWDPPGDYARNLMASTQEEVQGGLFSCPVHS